jgi:zinc/manganese transport system permease protein
MDTVSPNLVADLRQMLAWPFMVNAFRAGTVVAVLAAVTGFFMVTRRQAFAGHSLSVVGFPGAAAAVWLGVPAASGYYAFCLAAALLVASRPAPARSGYSEQSALVGTVQAFALACGLLFVSLYRGFLNGTNALLFGSFLGITSRQVLVLAVVAVVALGVLAVVGRPLWFASVDPAVARAHGVPVRALDVTFLLLLGLAVAAAAQITGALLVFALLVLPAATAQQLTARPARALLYSVALAVTAMWAALFAGFYSPYPIGFWLTSIAFGGYAVATVARRLA